MVLNLLLRDRFCITSSCRTDGTTKPGDDVVETNVYYVWSVFVLVTTPYIWSIIVHCWKIVGRKSDVRHDVETDKDTDNQNYLPYLRLLIVSKANHLLKSTDVWPVRAGIQMD